VMTMIMMIVIDPDMIIVMIAITIIMNTALILLNHSGDFAHPVHDPLLL